ncbi:MAG: PAS domain-containing protein [Streptosporangiaceae bacterium]
MTGPQVDYAAVYRQLPIPVLLLTPEFAIADVNQASLQATGRTRDELLGRSVFDAFPSDPSDPGATTVRSTIASLRRVLATGEPSAMEFQKSDIEVPGSPGLFARYYWSGVNAPVLGPDGRVALIAIMAEDVTDRLRRFMSGLDAEAASRDLAGRSCVPADTFPCSCRASFRRAGLAQGAGRAVLPQRIVGQHLIGHWPLASAAQAVRPGVGAVDGVSDCSEVLVRRCCPAVEPERRQGDPVAWQVITSR